MVSYISYLDAFSTPPSDERLCQTLVKGSAERGGSAAKNP